MDINENYDNLTDSLYGVQAEDVFDIKAELNRVVSETLFNGDKIEEDSDLDVIFYAALHRTEMLMAKKVAAMFGIPSADSYSMLEVIEFWDSKKESTPMTVEQLRLEYEKSYEANKSFGV